jgi:FAD/FMN-containing dehydrogenase
VDYAWFSNLLEETLAGCCAEVVAWPQDDAELAGVLAAAYDARVPVTIRGGGTGNYGQCVPLLGGLVVNMSRMNRVLEVGDGHARVQAGVKLVTLDRAAQATGQEIRIYPSTYLTATVVGFVCGGSGGIGSVTHGFLADGNVLSATVYPVTDSPAPETAPADQLDCYIHAYGTTGVLADVTVPLAPRIAWEQAVLSFPDLLSCHAFCMALLDDASIDKRLVSTAEPGVVRHFARSRVPFHPDRTCVLLMVGAGQLDRVTTLATRHGGRLDFALPRDTKIRLSDFTWNHTTAWAKKDDPSLTYLQVAFSADSFEEQLRAIRAEYGDDFAVHGEYARFGGRPFVGALPIVPYQSEQYIDRMIAFLESIGMFVANPHTYVLEEGSRTDNVAELLEMKRRHDPAGLLNPGKLGAARKKAPAISRREATLGLAASRRSLTDLSV